MSNPRILFLSRLLTSTALALAADGFAAPNATAACTSPLLISGQTTTCSVDGSPVTDRIAKTPDLHNATLVIEEGVILSRGLELDGSGNTVTNSGTIQPGDSLPAIALSGGTPGTSNTIDNFGVIGGSGQLAISRSNDSSVALHLDSKPKSSILGDVKLNNIPAAESAAPDDVLIIGHGSALTGSVTLGDGNDQITFGNEAKISGTVALGAGNNQFTLGVDAKLGGMLTAGKGDDKVTLGKNSSVSSDIDLGDGSNVLTVGDGTKLLNGWIVLGLGDDTVVLGNGVTSTVGTAVQLGGGKNSLTIGKGAGFQSPVQGGSGDDTVILKNGAIVSDTLFLLEGNNTVTLEDEASVGSVVTKSGDDKVNLGGRATAGGVELGDGSNTLTLGESARVDSTITTGAGDDTVTLGKNSSVSSDIDLGDGSNVLTVGDGTKLLNGWIVLGLGDDTVVLGNGVTSAVGTVVQLGGGKNSLTVGKGAGFKSQVQGGSGDDTVTLKNGAIVSDTLFLLEGNNTVTLEDEASVGSVVTKSGDDTVTLGNGAMTGGVSLGDGKNNLMLGESASVKGAVTAGADNDTVTLKQGAVVTGDLSLSGGNNTVTLEDKASVGTITTGDGDDVIGLGNGATANGMTLGKGDNKLTLGESASVTAPVEAGDGNNTIFLDKMASVDAIALGTGTNGIILDDGASVGFNITTGSGDDTVKIGPNAHVFYDINLGDGNNNLTLDENATIYIPITRDIDWVDEAYITTGSGNDAIVLGRNAQAHAAIFLGSGNNTLTLEEGAVLEDYITADAGDDEVTIGKSASVIGSINLGDGNNRLTFSEGAAQNSDAEIHLGSGDDAVTAQAGSTVGSLVVGGGGYDTLTLVGDTAVPTVWRTASIEDFEKISKSGSGVWELRQSLGYDDPVAPLEINVEGGTLALGGNNSRLNAKAVVADGATLQGSAVSLPSSIADDGDVTITGEQKAFNTYIGTISGKGTLTIDALAPVEDDLDPSASPSSAADEQAILAWQLSHPAVVTLLPSGTDGNSYTGGTIIRHGILAVGSDSALGALDGALTIGDGSLETRADMTMNRLTTLTGTAGLITDGGTTLTQEAAISGSGSLTKSGDGTLVLTGTADHEGGTVIAAGTLQVGNGGTGGRLGGDVADNGTLTFNRSGTLAFGGGISGSGGVKQTGSGTVMFDKKLTYGGDTQIASGTFAAGDENVFSKASQHEVAAGATLDTGGYDQTIAGLANDGVVILGHGGSSGTSSGAGTVLTVVGNYTGNNGTVVLNTYLGGDASPTDMLKIGGDSRGSSLLQVTNAGGPGAPTVNGIKVIDVAGASEGSFVLSRGDYELDGQKALVAGAYAYRLYKNGITTAADGGWYLRSVSTIAPVTPPAPVVTPPVSGPATPAGTAPVIAVQPEAAAVAEPLYQAGVPLYESYGQTLLGLNGMGTLRERMGERSWTGPDIEASGEGKGSGSGLVGAQAGHVDTNGIWARVEGRHVSVGSGISTSNADYAGNVWKLQSGVDGLLYENTGGVFTGGLSVHYGSASADISSRHGDGSISTAGYGLGSSLTWFGQNGFYVDGQAQVSWYDSDLVSQTAGLRLAEGNDGIGYALSLEAGRPYETGGSWTLTPQAQLVWSSVAFDSFTDPFGAHVSLDRAQSLKGRLGVSADYRNAWTGRDGRIARSSLYTIANVYYEFLEGTQVNVADTVFTSAGDWLWGGIGLGGTFNWANDRYALHGQVALDTSLANPARSFAVNATTAFTVTW